VAVASAALTSACSDTNRSAGRFCAELQAQLPSLTTPPATSDDIDDLVRRFERLNRITPLAIEEEWTIVTDLVEMASNVIPSDPASRQELADAAYKAERPARDMTAWVEATCGFSMPDVIGIEGNP
jgi:predicted component of type VI protein secretion system